MCVPQLSVPSESELLVFVVLGAWFSGSDSGHLRLGLTVVLEDSVRMSLAEASSVGRGLSVVQGCICYRLS